MDGSPPLFAEVDQRRKSCDSARASSEETWQSPSLEIASLILSALFYEALLVPLLVIRLVSVAYDETFMPRLVKDSRIYLFSGFPL